MKLYHATKQENVPSIMSDGLKPNSLGIVYFSPTFEAVNKHDAVLEVETGGLKLTAFEDCSNWEVLCWTEQSIPPTQINQIGKEE